MATANPISVSEIMTSQRDNAARNTAAAAEVEESRKGAMRQSDLAAEAQQTTGLNAATIIREAAALKMDNERRRSENAANFGVNDQANSSILQSSAQDILRMREELQASARNIAAKKSVGLFDDPFQYIGNQLTLPKDVEAHNAKVDQLEVEVSTLGKLQALTTAQDTIINATSATINSEMVAAQTAKVSAEAAKDAAITRYNAQVQNVGFIDTRMKMANAPLSSLLQANEAIQQRINSDIANRNANLREQELRQTIAKNELELDKWKTNKTYHDNLQAQIDDVTSKFGFPKIFVENLPLMSQKDRDALLDMIKGSPNGRAGFTPTAALDNVKATNAPLTPAIRAVALPWLEKEVYAIKSGTHFQQTLPGKKAEEISASVDANLRESFKREAANVPASGGLYSPPPLASLADHPAMADNQVWQLSGYSELAKNRMMPLNPQDVYDNATRLVIAGKITAQAAAASVAEMMKVAVDQRNMVNGYTRLSIPAPTNFMFSLNTGQRFGTKPVDMTNETLVTNELLRKVTLHKYEQGQNFIEPTK